MSVLATDDFNRADATGLGANWASVLADHNILGNRAAGNVVSYSYNTSVVWPDDQWSKLTLKSFVGLSWVAPTVRQAVGVRTMYAGGADPLDFAGGSIRTLWKEVANSRTKLANEAVAVANDDVFYLRAVGTSIKLYVNGSERLSVTDASIASGSAGFTGRSTVADSPTVDDWSGGDVTAEPGIGDGSYGWFHGHTYIGIDI